ncbi:WecB/TagA/CpsF family glycosyltransferase [Aestuariicella hydrocarbonica]|uniref:WecB/TagA/CpsF family glycosyltransferase n=1 Tax=Pseudomaricurvus hydrocarbonicus TaxID=1470433 RepID=A0A9E5MQA0_9GAMM|nr:WecB/TagA/CpsF family glycosyltransferase [Aestuariicella hydrocarbonica]NHO68481.1 WecB/TagA/CpsF family glycosyltransferase [Aestuariicella hydrocarbonica]
MGKPIVKVAGIEINDLRRAEVLELLGRAVMDKDVPGELVVTPNLDHLTQILNDRLFCGAYKKATLTIVDGFPVKLLSFLKLKAPLKEVIPGSEFTIELFERVNRELPEGAVCNVFILGANDKTIGLVRDRFEQDFPKLKLVGAFTGKIIVDDNISKLSCYLSDEITGCEVDLVIGSLGAPKQEVVCSLLHAKNPKITFLCVGATLEFFVGVKKRAPLILRRMKLEWLYRWSQEPYRLTRRYLLCFLTFLKLAFYKWERV